MTPIDALKGKSITTLEGLPALYAQQKGLKEGPALHPVSQAFTRGLGTPRLFRCG